MLLIKGNLNRIQSEHWAEQDRVKGLAKTKTLRFMLPDAVYTYKVLGYFYVRYQVLFCRLAANQIMSDIRVILNWEICNNHMNNMFITTIFTTSCASLSSLIYLLYITVYLTGLGYFNLFIFLICISNQIIKKQTNMFLYFLLQHITIEGKGKQCAFSVSSYSFQV